GCRVVVRDLAKTRHQRFETFFYFFLTGCRDACKGAPMKRVEGGDYLKPALVVPEFARQLEQTFIGLHAAIAKETFARTDQAAEGLGQPPLGFVIIEIRSVDELARLLHQRLRDGRMRVTQ